jgi:PAS domain-containing protein
LLHTVLDPANYAYNWQALPHFAVALALAVSCGLIVYWERGTRVSLMFAAATALFIVWLLGRGVMRLVVEPTLAVALGRFIYVMIMLAMPLLYQLVTLLLRREHQRRAFIRFNWLVGVLLAALAISTPWVIGSSRQFAWGLEPQHGPLGGVIVLWTLALIGTASVDLFTVYRRVAPGSVERRRIGWFAVAMLCLYGASADFLPSSGLAVYPFAFLPVLGFALVTAYVTLRFGLVEVTPQLAANELAEMMRGGVLLLDRDGVIQVVNRRATLVLGREAAALVGQPVREVLGEAAAGERRCRSRRCATATSAKWRTRACCATSPTRSAPRRRACRKGSATWSPGCRTARCSWSGSTAPCAARARPAATSTRCASSASTACASSTRTSATRSATGCCWKWPSGCGGW